MKSSSILMLLLVAISFVVSCRTGKTRNKSPKKSKIQASGISYNKMLEQEAAEWIGVTYRYGGLDKQGVDCSGLVSAIYRKLYHREIPRTVIAMHQLCRKIALNELREGDLVFFNPGTKEVSHVGIFLGGNRFVHASVSKGVVISKLDNPYYVKCFEGGGRL